MSLSAGIGLFSGLDFNSIISQLMALNARPLNIIRSREQVLAIQKSSLQTVNQAVLKVHSALTALQDRDSLAGRTITSTEFEIAFATATKDSALGSFEVKVLQLAKEHRIAAQGVADEDATAIASATGLFQYSVGDGEVTTINVTSATTLAQLRDAINSDPDSAVQASIINDGSQTDAYRLVLTSKQTGADNTIQILTNDTTLDFSSKTIEAAAADPDNTFAGTVTSSGTYTGTGSKQIVVEVTTAGAIGVAQYRVSTDGGLTFGPDNEFTTSGTPTDISGGEGVLIDFSGASSFALGDKFTIDAFDPNLQTAADAIIEIDGVQVRRSSNEISGAIDGVTIQAKKVDAALATTLTIRQDDFNINSNIQNFVGAYNDLLDVIEAHTFFDVENKARGPLFGDSGIRAIRSSLSNIVSTAVPGLLDFNSLGSIGVDLLSNGKLEIDSTELAKHITDDFAAVARIFAETGSSTSSGISYDSSTSSTVSGTYAIVVTQAAEQASFTGAQAVDSGGIALDELLTFTLGEKEVSVSIAAGATIAEVVTQLNDFFDDQGFTLQATDEGGALKIQTVGFGSGESFSILSDQSGATSTQLGIGTTTVTKTGIDVAGTINGIAATGTGQFLEGAEGTNARGLRLKIDSPVPISGQITLTRGIAAQLLDRIDAITDTTDGLIKTKTDSIDRRIEDIGERILAFNRRLASQEKSLRRQFTVLELRIASLQNQGNFLIGQLEALSLSFTNRNRR